MPNTSTRVKKTIIVAAMRKGANGTSECKCIDSDLLPDKRLLIIRNMLHIAPSQNANITADIPEINPSIAPIPNTSLASPKPIHLPEDTSHIRAKGTNKTKGADISNKSIGVRIKSLQ